MFVDLGETSTGRSDSSAASHAGRTTNVVLCLMATALIGSSVVGWRLISVWESQHAELQRSNRVFNQELVQAVQSLAENTGVLTSADLSPVKFRLRSAKGPGSSPPARSVSAELLKATDSGTYQNVTNDMSRPSGLLDFGLQEPGQYRLRIKLPDGMATAHDFECCRRSCRSAGAHSSGESERYGILNRRGVAA